MISFSPYWVSGTRRKSNFLLCEARNQRLLHHLNLSVFPVSSSTEGGRLFEGFIRRSKMAAPPPISEKEEEAENGGGSRLNGGHSLDDTAIDENQPIIRHKKESQAKDRPMSCIQRQYDSEANSVITFIDYNLLLCRILPCVSNVTSCSSLLISHSHFIVSMSFRKPIDFSFCRF